MARLRAGSEIFDLLIVGGGASGLGAAVDAAARGHRVALIEQGEDPIETPSGEFGSLTLAAQNPEYAVAQFRMLVARMSELSSVTDTQKIGQALQQPGKATELERSIWEQLDRSRPKF